VVGPRKLLGDRKADDGLRSSRCEGERHGLDWKGKRL
jgi:hypothetical protein